MKPPAIESSWSLLDYDVSDSGCLSGLSNYGYKEGDFLKYACEYWGKMLNENHLFHELEDTLVFTRFSDKRIPAHVPFFV